MDAAKALEPHGSVAELVRYPVKSMGGESIQAGELTSNGLAYDRLYAFESEAAPPGMLRVSGRERKELLGFLARQTEHGVVVSRPAGEKLPVEDHRLITSFPNFSSTHLTCAERPQTDCRPLSVISRQTIRQLGEELGRPLDPRRFRANLYLDLAEPFAEDDLVGTVLHIGPVARIRILERDPRCRLITLDPENVEEPIPQLMTLLHRQHQGRAGVYASVLTPGTIRVGDPVSSANGPEFTRQRIAPD